MHVNTVVIVFVLVVTNTLDDVSAFAKELSGYLFIITRQILNKQTLLRFLLHHFIFLTGPMWASSTVKDDCSVYTSGDCSSQEFVASQHDYLGVCKVCLQFCSWIKMWLNASGKASEDVWVPCVFHSFVFFISDYESLRIGGLVFAVVLFLMGIILIVSKCFTVSAAECVTASRCHHTVILVWVCWPRRQNVSVAAKQAGFCFLSEVWLEGGRMPLPQSQHSTVSCLVYHSSPLYLISLLTGGVLPRFFLLPASTWCYCQCSPETKPDQ